MFQNPNTYRRVGFTPTGPSKTQQNQKDNCDINKIYKHFQKYGVIPENVAVRTPKFQDNSMIPSFQEAQNMMQEASAAFEKIPLEIRKLCDHNPAKVMDFIHDPQNKAYLEKYGMLAKPKVAEPDPLDLLQKIAKNTEKEPVTA